MDKPPSSYSATEGYVSIQRKETSDLASMVTTNEVKYTGTIQGTDHMVQPEARNIIDNTSGTDHMVQSEARNM